MAGCESFRDLSRFRSLKNKTCDVVVIGGGINGAAAARDAALRGLQVVLLEKSDFGAGASTKTSKLAHGGLRYLEQLEFRLVKESLDERTLLLRNAPHLVHPIPFIMPVYSFSPRPLWQVNLGLSIYDFLSRKSGLPKHRMLNLAEAIGLVPEMARDGLKGGCVFQDAWMMDNRLVIENVLAAEQAGALVFNYAKVTGLSISQGRINEVHFKDMITGEECVIACKVVINAAGAWSNKVGAMTNSQGSHFVDPTKGVHLVIPQVSGQYALLLRAPQDGRVFFVLPWGGYSLLGTTDTFYNDDPDRVAIEESDIAYLCDAFNAHFPGMPIDATSIIAMFAGLRPLASNRNRNGSPSTASRGHSIEVSEEGMINIFGGKFTTHRRIAEETVDRVATLMDSLTQVGPCLTTERPLPGAADSSSLKLIAHELLAAGLEKHQVDHLLMNYGRLSVHILEIILNNGEEHRQICAEHPHIFAEVTYAVQSEYARQLDDWFCRRTSIAYTPCRGEKCLEIVAAKFASLLGWEKSHKEAAVISYRNRLKG